MQYYTIDSYFFLLFEIANINCINQNCKEMKRWIYWNMIISILVFFKKYI